MTHCERASVRAGRVNGVWVVNKGGRQRLGAEVVIDCTADADLAASAGVACEQGNPGDGRLQHVNYRYWLEGVDGETYQREKPAAATLEAMCRAAVADGRLRPPSQLFQPQVESFPYNQRSRTLCAVNWELAGVDPTDPIAVSRTLTECQVAVWHLLPFLRTLPGFEQCKLRKLPEVLGVRESRRVVGLARLTAEDVVQAHKYPDGIARACFYMDLHDSPPGLVVPHETAVLKARRPPHGDWYEIRYGCLVPRAVTGLLVAGRCISADRDAHGSARVMPTCMFLGTAAGTAAAMALRQGTLPHTLDGRAVRAQLGPHFGR
jgi:hypothetical protein